MFCGLHTYPSLCSHTPEGVLSKLDTLTHTMNNDILIREVFFKRTNTYQLLNKMKIRHVLLFCICFLFPLRCLSKRSSCSGMQREVTLLVLVDCLVHLLVLRSQICSQAFAERPRSPPSPPLRAPHQKLQKTMSGS